MAVKYDCEVDLSNIKKYDLHPPEYKPDGGYDITGRKGKDRSVVFMLKDKPKFVHRFFCKLLLGWDWVDKDNTNIRKIL